MVLWGLTGDYIDGRLVTMAAQAGTTGLRDAMDGFGVPLQICLRHPGDTVLLPIRSPVLVQSRVPQRCCAALG
jgi:hypothetical protein